MSLAHGKHSINRISLLLLLNLSEMMGKSKHFFWLISFMPVIHVFNLNFSSSLHLGTLPATHFTFCSWRLGAFPDAQLFDRAEWQAGLFCLLKANFEEGTQCSLHTVASRWRPSSAHLLVVLTLSSKCEIRTKNSKPNP